VRRPAARLPAWSLRASDLCAGGAADADPARCLRAHPPRTGAPRPPQPRL